MLDLETLSTDNDAVILQIGAVVFDPVKMILAERFVTTISIQSCLDAGLTVSGNTMAFWFGEDLVKARKTVLQQQQTLGWALEAFRGWVFQVAGDDADDHGEAPSAILWAGPARFDLGILRNAYEVLHCIAPWSFRNERCYTTLRHLRPGIERIIPIIAHDALCDAMAQAEHAVLLLRAIELGPHMDNAQEPVMVDRSHD